MKTAHPNTAPPALFSDAGPTVPLWPDAGRALGASRSQSYALARRGEFPAKVIRLGAAYRVVTADLVRLLSVDDLHGAA